MPIEPETLRNMKGRKEANLDGPLTSEDRRRPPAKVIALLTAGMQIIMLYTKIQEGTTACKRYTVPNNINHERNA